MTDARDAGHYLPVTREDFQQQIEQLNQATQQWKSGAAAAEQVITTQGEKHQQVIQGYEPELAEERSNLLVQVLRPEVSQARQKHIARNKVTIGKLQKSVAQE
jgi:lipopolysaccharide biosynthesis regulator YciM